MDKAMRRQVVRLLQDDSGLTFTRYFVAAAAPALMAVAVSRPIAAVLASILYRVHVIATLALP